MASFTLTAEDSSPLITYAPEGSWTDDSLATSGTSYHATSAKDATASITFTGTGVSVFGSHRPDYGTYSLIVDGETVATGSSQSSTASPRELLAKVEGLEYGRHTAIFTNTGSGPIDIDSIDFIGQTGLSSAPATSTILDDSSADFVYSPVSAWQTASDDSFMEGTSHTTQQPGALASLSFTGSAIAVYGTVSPNHANMRITLDGESQMIARGSGVLSSRTRTLLYYGSDLGEGKHNIAITRDPTATNGQIIDLDSITVYSLSSDATDASLLNGAGSSPAASVSAAAAARTSAPSQPTSVPTGIIVGAAVAGVIAVLSLIGIAVLLALRRRWRRNSADVEKSMAPVIASPILPLQETREPKMPTDGRSAESRAFPFPPNNIGRPIMVQSRQSTISVAPSYYGSQVGYASHSHSRQSSAMSGQSSTPLIRVPKPPRPLPKPGLAMGAPRPYNYPQDNRAPARPRTRPPTMNFPPYMDDRI